MDETLTSKDDNCRDIMTGLSAPSFSLISSILMTIMDMSSVRSSYVSHNRYASATTYLAPSITSWNCTEE